MKKNKTITTRGTRPGSFLKSWLSFIFFQEKIFSEEKARFLIDQKEYMKRRYGMEKKMREKRRGPFSEALKPLFSKNNRMNFLVGSLIVLAAGAIVVWNTEIKSKASFTESINYQARITDSMGGSVEDGNYSFRFRICSNSACTGGSDPLWVETRCYSPDNGASCTGTGIDQRIALSGSILNAMLGDINPMSSLDFNQVLYLEVQIGGSGVLPNWETFTPRKKIGAVPASFEAKRLAGKTWEIPGEMGLLTPNTGRFTTLEAINSGDVLILSGDGAGIYFSGVGDAQLKTATDQNLLLSPGGTGNIGINNANPRAKLSIKGGTELNGVGTISSIGTAVTGSGTSFDTEILPGDTIEADSQRRTVVSVTDSTNITVDYAFSPDLSGVAFSYQKPIAYFEDAISNSVLFMNQKGSVGLGTLSPKGQIHIVGNSDSKQIIVQAIDSQTENIQEWQDDTGIYLVAISADGHILLNSQNSQVNPAELVFSNTDTTGDFRIYSDNGEFQLQGGGGRELQIGSYSGITLMGGRGVSSDIDFVDGAGNIFNTMVLNTDPLSMGLVIYGASGQTSDIVQWRDGGTGAALGGINADGSFNVVSSSGATYTASKLGTTITATSGPAFVASDVGKYFVWGDGGNVIDIITAFIDSTNLTVATSGTITSQTGYLKDAAFYVGASGNVGIGTSGPLFKLHVYKNNGDTDPAFGIQQLGGGDASQIFYKVGAQISMGIDGSDGNIFKITNAVGLTGNTYSDANTFLRIYTASGSGGILDINHQSRARAYLGSNQSIPSSVATKVAFGTESYDEQGEFDSASSHRFVAKQAGYYQINSRIRYDFANDPATYAYFWLAIYKNGTVYSYGNRMGVDAGGKNIDDNSAGNVSDTIYLNSGDYIEVYTFHTDTTPGNLVGGSAEGYISIHKSS